MWTRFVNPEITTGETWAITMPIDFDDQDQPVIQMPIDVGLGDPASPTPYTLERISSSTAYPD